MKEFPKSPSINWSAYRSIVYVQMVAAIANSRMGGVINIDIDFVKFDSGKSRQKFA